MCGKFQSLKSFLIVGDVDEYLPLIYAELGVHLMKGDRHLNMRPLLRLICQRFFGEFAGFTTMCVQLKSPLANARNKVDHDYTGPVDTELAEAIFECDPEGPLMVHTTKLYPIEDVTNFHVFGRVISATLPANQKIRIL
ncbi:hypothetical protein LSAT2_010853 [Lamellibrachia satsuma]|nr:hypothetical protein LSAT2_010853 [Lamellibrachia satsuma]